VTTVAMTTVFVLKHDTLPSRKYKIKGLENDSASRQK